MFILRIVDGAIGEGMFYSDHHPEAAIIACHDDQACCGSMHHIAGGGRCEIDTSMAAIIVAIEVKPLTQGWIAGVIKALGNKVPVAVAGNPAWRIRS